jgi:hypothetical protein
MDLSMLVGKTEEEAKELIEATKDDGLGEGLRWRDVRRDGQAYVCTRDYRLDRVNLETEKGIVTRAYLG